MKRITEIILLSIMIALTGCSQSKKAEAQNGPWKPSKDITITNPWSVGGSADTKTRLVAQYLEEVTNQSVIVTTINGGAGALAAADFLGKKYNDHNMLLPGIGMFTLAPLMNKNLPYKFEDFKVVAELVSEPFILYVNPKESGIKSLDDLLKYGKDNHLVFASNPPGGTTYLLESALFKMADVGAESVAGSSVENITALLGGHVQVTAANPSVGLPYMKDGSLIPIAVFSEEDYTGFDGLNVPSIKKALGFDIVFESSNFFVLGKEASDEVVNYYYKAFMSVYDNPEFLAKAKELSYTPSKKTPEELEYKILNTSDLFERLSELVVK